MTSKSPTEGVHVAPARCRREGSGAVDRAPNRKAP